MLNKYKIKVQFFNNDYIPTSTAIFTLPNIKSESEAISLLIQKFSGQIFSIVYINLDFQNNIDAHYEMFR